MCLQAFILPQAYNTSSPLSILAFYNIQSCLMNLISFLTRLPTQLTEGSHWMSSFWNSMELHQQRVRSGVRKKIFTQRVVGHGRGSPGCQSSKMSGERSPSLNFRWCCQAGGAEQSQELHSLILVSPFQFWIFYVSIIRNHSYLCGCYCKDSTGCIEPGKSPRFSG